MLEVEAGEDRNANEAIITKDGGGRVKLAASKLPLAIVGVSVATRGTNQLYHQQSPSFEICHGVGVKDVAETACKELFKRYPNGTPSEAECAKAAADKAMVVVNGWAALASKASGK